MADTVAGVPPRLSPHRGGAAAEAEPAARVVARAHAELLPEQRADRARRRVLREDLRGTQSFNVRVVEWFDAKFFVLLRQTSG